jgi:hypothetical protein
MTVSGVTAASLAPAALAHAALGAPNGEEL